MNLKKLNWILILFSIISIPILYTISDNSALIQGKLINNGIVSILKKPPNVIYDLNIPLKNNMISRLKTYKVRGIKNTIDDIEYYIEKLNIKGKIQETSKEFKIKDKNIELIVSKDDGLIQYKNTINKKPNNKITTKKAIKNATDFITALNLSCNYKKILVEDTEDENKYQIRFINTLEGILNYAYYTKADISYSGEVLNIEYYKLIYEPMDLVNIKTIKKSYDELKEIPLEENIQIDIKKADLVYILNSSTKKIEPAYRFFGETNKEKTFEYFISAVNK